MPHWVAFPGQKTNLPISVQNLTDKPITLTLRIGAVIASIKGEPVRVSLKPKEQRQINLPVEVKPFADWGVKTVFVKGTWNTGQGTRETAYWLRPLIVGRNADVRCLTTAVTSHTPTIPIVNAPTTPFGDLSWWHPALDVPGERARDVEVILRLRASAKPPEDVKLPREIRLPLGDLPDGETKQIRLPLPFSSSPVLCPASLSLRWRDSAGTHERTIPLNVVLLPKELPKTHPNQVATIIVADTGEVAGTPISVRLTKEIRDDNLVVRLPDGTTLPTHTEKAKGNRRIVHFVLPPTKSLWQVDIGVEGDEQVLVYGFSHRETWAGGLTIRWLPGEGRETVLRVQKPKVEAPAYRLLLRGQAHWGNKVSVFAGEQKLGDLDIRTGLQILKVALPASLWECKESVDVRIVFHQAHVPAEKIQGSTDKRVCNFALDWVALEPALDAQPLLLALCRTEKQQKHQISVQVQDGVVRVDNGVLELEWREDAGGTLTKLLSKATGRNYAAQGCGAGIGIFGRFDPTHPAVMTDKFIVDDFVWQRDGKATVKVTERNPVWVTVEVMGHGAWDAGHGSIGERVGFKAVQRYRVFAGLPLIELQVSAEPLKPSPKSPVPESCELVVLEARFNARWWTKSFPNFVGLGDKPPEVYGQHIVHFGWRMGDWLPPILCLFNPSDLTETLSLLIAEFADFSAWQESRLPISASRPTELPISQPHEILVRQGFWGEQRGKPATERRYATMEIAATPPRPVRLRLWLWLHEGHHQQARQHRQQMLHQNGAAIIAVAR
jgi:hypothetical protein